MEKLIAAAMKYKRGVNTLYDLISIFDRQGDMRVMNYGFHTNKGFPLRPADEPFRERLALYDHVARGAPVSFVGKKVLEVGSGRGGGTSHLAWSFRPQSIHGIDISQRAVDFCKGNYPYTNLSFGHGDAENIGFTNNSFDVVIDIESSHYYPHMNKAVAEAHRVLRPGGYYLLADSRPASKLDEFRELLQNGFTIVSEEDITDKVLQSLRTDNDQKKADIERALAEPFRGVFSHFSGVVGGYFYNRLSCGKDRFLNLVLQKPQ